jgi:predicted outer membrane repeat protein
MLSAMKSWPLRASHLLVLPLMLLGFWLLPVEQALAADCTGSRYYVDQDATGSNSGADWANAFTSLPSALTAAASCPGITEVWVAEGLYKPGTVAADTFSIRAGLAVYGGFAGTEENLNQRNWVSNVTILSGDIDGNDTVDADGVVTATTNIVSPNAFHVATMDGTTNPITGDTRLDGFVITAGYAHSAFTDPNGGGLYCNGQGLGSECSPTLANIIFSGNSAEMGGGAVANLGAGNGKSSPALSNVTFTGNQANHGGAMYNDADSAGTSSPALNHVTFNNNSTTPGGVGGAMLNAGVGSGRSSPQLTDVTFTSNSAKDGGAIYNDCAAGTSSPTLNRVTFADNRATGNGGAMMTLTLLVGLPDTCKPLLTNVVFLNNAAAQGGGMYTQGFSEMMVPVLINVTFAGNEGTAMFNNINASVNETLPISNTIFYANDNEIINIGSVVPIIRHSLVQNSGGSGGGWDSSIGIDDGGNIDADPDFVNGISGDLRLRAGSPAIDTGDNSAVSGSMTTDIAGAPRIFDGNGDSTATVDMGAHEFAFFPLNVARNGSGSGTVSSVPAGINCGADCTDTLNAGSVMVLTATPASTSNFAGWSGTCNGTGACNVTVYEANQVTATFTLKQYAIDASVDVPGGGALNGAGTYIHGETVTLTAMSNIGYTFINWTEGDTEVSTEPIYSFTAAGNRTLVANFRLNQYAVDLSADPAAGGAVTGGGTVNHGDTVVVTATPNSGYTFVNWTQGDTEVSTDATFVFPAMFGRTLVAHFSLDSYALNISADPDGGGTVSGAEVASHGETVTLTATANTGYTFINWTEGDSEVSTDPSYSFVVTADRTLVANFAPVEDPSSKAFLPTLWR